MWTFFGCESFSSFKKKDTTKRKEKKPLQDASLHLSPGEQDGENRGRASSCYIEIEVFP